MSKNSTLETEGGRYNPCGSQGLNLFYLGNKETLNLFAEKKIL